MNDDVGLLDVDRVTDWLLTSGLRILIILVVLYVIYFAIIHIVPRGIRRGVAQQMEDKPEVEIEKRVHTLSAVVVATARVVLLFAAVFMILPEVGINIAPVLAGAGIAGLAIGFGAQSLVRDTISGVFVLAENQYGVGDIVSLAGVTGLVEDVNLRRTVLRDLDGTVHSIPNGEITTASNLTREWARVNMNVGVAYGEDIDKVREVINRVGQELAADKEFGPLVTEAPHFERVDGFGDSGIEIKILGVTRPIQQWTVMGELRRRLKRAFDEEGIEIPFPHRVLVTHGAKATDLP
jgi:small-conductance mechanosensitive channel